MKQQNEKPNLTVIIVNYNTRELLHAQLARMRWPVIVVDNGSTDGSTEEVKRRDVHLITNKVNKGFAAANNQGIAAAESDYILLLNTDCEASSAAIQETLRYLDDNPDVGAVTCKLVLPDGFMDPACHRGFPTPWASLTYFLGLERLFPASWLFGQYHQGFKPMNAIHDVDCISGAFFLVRRDVIEKVGLMDEAFFMYGEDIDWCYRIRQAGWKIHFYPFVSAVHRKHQSGLAHTDGDLRLQTKRHFYDAMRLFYNKYYRRRYGTLISSLVLLGIKLRSLV